MSSDLELTGRRAFVTGGSKAVGAAVVEVTAVQNPLTSLDDSVAATRRAVALQAGPTVLVAHSSGGTVITEVGTAAAIAGYRKEHGPSTRSGRSS